MRVGVFEGVSVPVGVALDVAVSVTVSVGVGVGVKVTVGVAVMVPAIELMINSGRIGSGVARILSPEGRIWPGGIARIGAWAGDLISLGWGGR